MWDSFQKLTLLERIYFGKVVTIHGRYEFSVVYGRYERPLWIQLCVCHTQFWHVHTNRFFVTMPLISLTMPGAVQVQTHTHTHTHTQFHTYTHLNTDSPLGQQVARGCHHHLHGPPLWHPLHRCLLHVWSHWPKPCGVGHGHQTFCTCYPGRWSHEGLVSQVSGWGCVGVCLVLLCGYRRNEGPVSQVGGWGYMGVWMWVLFLSYGCVFKAGCP